MILEADSWVPEQVRSHYLAHELVRTWVRNRGRPSLATAALADRLHVVWPRMRLIFGVRSIVGVSDVCICLDTAARHRYWRWTAFRHAVIAAGVAWGLWTEPNLWWWVGPIGAVFLISILYRINRGYGRTLLKSDCIVFHTFLSSKSIPWAEVTRIEMRNYHARLGDWWELRIFRVHGRSLRVPGAFSSSRKDVEDLKTKLSVIRAYWSQQSDR